MGYMELNEELMRNYTTILKEELVAAMGCTEPIAIAYAAAKARSELGEMPEHILISCSGNMIKNVNAGAHPDQLLRQHDQERKGCDCSQFGRTEGH